VAPVTQNPSSHRPRHGEGDRLDDDLDPARDGALDGAHEADGVVTPDQSVERTANGLRPSPATYVERRATPIAAG
jgi:hypothetical protein